MAVQLTLAVFFTTVFLIFVSLLSPRKHKALFKFFACPPPFYVWPVVGSLVLLASGTAYAQLGDGKIVPQQILALFYALAYLCVSLDATGFLALLSLYLLNQSRGSSRRLFFITCFLSMAITVTTSNDIVTLTLTPIILHACKQAGLDPKPFIIISFFMSNSFSSILIIGNPTNIIVGQAMGLTFLDFFLKMALPALCGALTTVLTLYLFFYADLKKPFVPPVMDLEGAIKDVVGARIQGLVLALTLVIFTVAQFIGVQLWLIALIGGLCSFAVDLARLPLWKSDITYDTLNEILPDEPSPSSPSSHCASAAFSISTLWASFAQYLRDLNRKRGSRLMTRNEHLQVSKVPNVWSNICGLPLDLIPFLLGQFFLVEQLDKQGIIESFANWLVSSMGNMDVFAAGISMTLLTCFACSLLNNIPATIVLTRVLLSDALTTAPSSFAQASMMGIIIGSNFGACFTVIASLAGVMFFTIVQKFDPNILTFAGFSKVGCLCVPWSCVIAGIVIGLEIAI